MRSESKFVLGCYKLTDQVILNVLYFLCCIPIITAGAASCALYSNTLKMTRDEEGSVVKDYFRTFRKNFKQATVLWLIMLVVALFFYVDFRISASISSDTARSLYFGFMIALLLVYLSTLSYLFPLIAWFDNKNLQMIKNALRIGRAYLKYTIPIVIINLTPLTIIFIPGDYIKWMIALYFFIWFSGTAYLNSRMLRVLFDGLATAKEGESND